MRSRRRADAMAEDLLNSRAIITDTQITRLLDTWRFKPNFARKNITPDGAPFCHSDTIGLVLSRTGKVFVTKAARHFPNFLSVLCRWLQEHGRPEFSKPFCFTSICINQGFAPASVARQHTLTDFLYFRARGCAHFPQGENSALMSTACAHVQLSEGGCSTRAHVQLRRRLCIEM